MIDQYYVRPYDGDIGGNSLERILHPGYGPFETLEKAIEFIRQKLGNKDFGYFNGPIQDHEPDLVMGWHESEEEGCGGYAIYKQESHDA